MRVRRSAAYKPALLYEAYEYSQGHIWHANSRTGQTGKELLRNCSNTAGPDFRNFV